jgi:hypothetical protein
MSLFEFLNAQNGYRLVGYGVLFIVVVAIVVSGLVSIIEHISNAIKRRKTD